MKFKIEYEPTIHSKLCESLNKERQRCQNLMAGGIANKSRALQQRSITIAGKTIDITKGLREQVNNVAFMTQDYQILEVGTIVFEVRSTIEKLPFPQLFKRMMRSKVKSELKKEFGKDILAITEIKE